MSFENDKLYQLDENKYYKKSKYIPPEPPKPVINREEFLNEVYKEFKESSTTITNTNDYYFKVGKGRDSLFQTVNTTNGDTLDFAYLNWGYRHGRYKYNSGLNPPEPWPYPGIGPLPGSIPSDLTYGKAKTWIEHNDLSFTYEEAKPDNPSNALVLKPDILTSEPINTNDPKFYNEYDLTPFLKITGPLNRNSLFTIELVTLWVKRQNLGEPGVLPNIKDELVFYNLGRGLTKAIRKLEANDVKNLGVVAKGNMFRFNNRFHTYGNSLNEDITMNHHLFNGVQNTYVSQYTREQYKSDQLPKYEPFTTGVSQHGLDIRFFIKALDNIPGGMEKFEDEFTIRLNNINLRDFYNYSVDVCQDILRYEHQTYIPILFTNSYGSGKYSNYSMLYFFTDWNAKYKFSPGAKAVNDKILGDVFDGIANEKGIDTI